MNVLCVGHITRGEAPGATVDLLQTKHIVLPLAG